MKLKLFFSIVIVFFFLGCKKKEISPSSPSSPVTPSSSGADMIEVTINGKTFKETNIGFFGFDDEPSYMNLYQSENADYQISIYIVYDKFNEIFKKSTTGEYRVIEDEPSNIEYEKNLDLAVLIGSSSKYQPFKLQPGSKHTVNSITSKGTDKDGNNEYMINATFSCIYINTENNSTYTISGKYNYTLTVMS